MARKIAYLIQGTFNSGGMERVITIKANYLQSIGYEVTIITTDQKNRAPFYAIDSKIKQIDLELNYLDDALCKGVGQYIRFLKRQRLYRQRLTQLLQQEQFDLVISTFGTERYIVPKIKDNSIKIAESHFARSYRVFRKRKGISGWLDKRRNAKDEQIAAKYSRFIVLTEQDMEAWKSLTNIISIANPVSFIPDRVSPLDQKRAIAVGRLTYQKGFDMLLDAWAKVQESGRCEGWRLDIFGSGEDGEKLQAQINQLGITKSVKINPPTSNIESELLDSSIYLLSSRREGLPMVLLEAMGCGVPAVSFECESGPRDVINNNHNGVLIDINNVNNFSTAIIKLMNDSDLRINMGKNARNRIVNNFSITAIMQRWEILFTELFNNDKALKYND